MRGRNQFSPGLAPAPTPATLQRQIIYTSSLASHCIFIGRHFKTPSAEVAACTLLKLVYLYTRQVQGY